MLECQLGTPLRKQCACMLSHFSHFWLFNAVDCSPPGSSVHGILQARTLEWVVSSSRRSSPPRDQTHVSCFLCWQASSSPFVPPGKPMETVWRFLKHWKWEWNYGNSCWLKKYSQPKRWELCFIRQEFSGLQAQVTPSQIRPALRRWGEESDYIQFCKKGQVVWISKDYC